MLTDQDLLSNLCRGPSIDALNQVEVPFSKRLKGRFLEIDQPEKTKYVIFIENIHRCPLPSFVSFGQAISEEKIQI